MEEHLEFAGRRLKADDLVIDGRPTSWPDIFSTEIEGTSLRWQYGNSSGPCGKDVADRLILPFAQADLPKGTAIILPPPRARYSVARPA